MNRTTLRLAPVFALVALAIGVGCAAAPEDEGPVQVETDQETDPQRLTGAVISSSSGGVIGGGSSGVIVKVPPGTTTSYPPDNCGRCSDYEGCGCPGGYGSESEVTCPAYAPYPRFVYGRWRCYGSMY